MEVSPNSLRYRDATVLNAYWHDVVDRVRSVAGVEDAALTITMPPDRTAFTDGFEIPDKTPADGGPIVPVPYVSTDYFRTLGIPLLRGRYFDAGDRIGSPRVAIISETMARRYFPAENPIGKRMKHGGPHQNLPYMEIVGVVGDVKYGGLDRANEPVYYEPAAQSTSRPMWLVVRTRGAAATTASSISAQIRSIDASVPISELDPMSRVLYDSVELPRFRAWLMGGFAFAALLLACVGLYGVIAYYVAQRTHEIGIRMALGATSQRVLGLIVGRTVRLVFGGILVGTLGALALVRFLKSMLFGTSPFDAPTFGLVALLLTFVAILAAWLPARRAARIDPMEALREE
jgi:predicted permease